MADKLEMIYDMVKDTNKDMKEIKNCMANMKVKQEKMDGRINMVENDLNHFHIECNEDLEAIQFDVKSHISDNKAHFDPLFNETNLEKIKRKKAEIGVSAGGGTLLTAIIYGLLRVAGYV